MKFALIELDEEQYEALANGGTVAEVEKPAKKDKKAKKDKPKKVCKKALTEAYDELVEATSKKEAKAVLVEKGFKTVKHVEEDQETIDDVLEAVNAAIAEAGGEDEGEEGGAEKAQELYQKYCEANSKKEGKAILEEYGVKKPKDISNLDADDLSDLIEELEDELDD